MTDAIRTIRPWLTFIGCVVVVVVLYFGQAIIVPLAFSVLMTSLLTPMASWLRRRIGRVPAVMITPVPGHRHGRLDQCADLLHPVARGGRAELAGSGPRYDPHRQRQPIPCLPTPTARARHVSSL